MEKRINPSLVQPHTGGTASSPTKSRIGQ